MRKVLVLVSCIVAAVSGSAAAQAPLYTPLPSITLPAELDRVLRDYERGWRAGDAAALAGLFTTDGFVPTRQGWVRGSADIRATYATASGPLRLRAHGYATADTVGYIVGAFGYGETPGGSDAGKFVLALRRAPGGPWLIAADLDAGNRP